MTDSKGIAGKADLRFEVPRVPNFLTVADSEQQIVVPVASVTDDTLREIGNAWTELLIAKARQGRT